MIKLTKKATPAIVITLFIIVMFTFFLFCDDYEINNIKAYEPNYSKIEIDKAFINSIDWWTFVVKDKETHSYKTIDFCSQQRKSKFYSKMYEFTGIRIFKDVPINESAWILIDDPNICIAPSYSLMEVHLHNTNEINAGTNTVTEAKQQISYKLKKVE